MARQGLLTHRKFIRLARLLGSDALAVGHLEIIWQATYEAGDPLLGLPADLEYLARWAGEQGKLSAALLEAGFVDEVENGELKVHDLIDHAPDYVQRRMEREEARRAKGQTISDLRANAGKKGGAAKAAKQAYSKRLATENHLSPDNIANGQETVAKVPTLALALALAQAQTLNTLPDKPAAASTKVDPVKPTTTLEAKKPRERNPLFDAIAEATGADPKVSGSHVGKLCAKLAESNYTPDEVRRWAELVTTASWWQGGRPSLGFMEKDIGRVRDKNPPKGKPAAHKPNPGVEYDPNHDYGA